MAVSSCLYIQSISDWILVLWLMLVFDRALAPTGEQGDRKPTRTERQGEIEDTE